MSELNTINVISVLKALQEGWALVDDGSELDYLKGISESRDELENFYPKKEFVKLMETQGFIVDTDKRPIEERTHTYGIWKGKNGWQTITELYPLVYLYEITEKGLEFLENN